MWIGAIVLGTLEQNPLESHSPIVRHAPGWACSDVDFLKRRGIDFFSFCACTRNLNWAIQRAHNWVHVFRCSRDYANEPCIDSRTGRSFKRGILGKMSKISTRVRHRCGTTYTGRSAISRPFDRHVNRCYRARYARTEPARITQPHSATCTRVGMFRGRFPKKTCHWFFFVFCMYTHLELGHPTNWQLSACFSLLSNNISTLCKFLCVKQGILGKNVDNSDLGRIFFGTVHIVRSAISSPFDRYVNRRDRASHARIGPGSLT